MAVEGVSACVTVGKYSGGGIVAQVAASSGGKVQGGAGTRRGKSVGWPPAGYSRAGPRKVSSVGGR